MIKKNVIEKIDILDLFIIIYKRKKHISLIGFIGGVIGLTISFMVPTEYETSIRLVPKSNVSSKKFDGLNDLAQMAGVDITNNEQSNFSINSYPLLVSSTPFLLELMNVNLQFSYKEKELSILEDIRSNSKSNVLQSIQKYTIGLPQLISSLLNKNNSSTITLNNKIVGIIELTEEEKDICKKLSKNIKLEINKKENYITLKARYSDPLATACLANQSYKLLQEYVIRMQTESTQPKLTYIQDRVKEKQEEFLLIQKKLAEHRDKNKNISTELARREEEILSNQYNLSFNVLSQLLKEYEQIKLIIKENTPTLIIIDPAIVPTIREQPKRKSMMIQFAVLTSLIYILILITKYIFKSNIESIYTKVKEIE